MGGGATAACRQALKAKRRRLLRAEAEDVMLISRMVFCGLLMLFAVSAARADETISRSGSRGEYLARAATASPATRLRAARRLPAASRWARRWADLFDQYYARSRDRLGSYSLEDFDRAVRHGIAKDGHRLYPAMPYPSYVKLTAEDVAALYSFFMKEVPAVHQLNVPNELPWPLSFRWPLAIWSFLFAPSGSYVAASDHNADWNRGAYLVQGLGHCGACHTPRGLAWQEKALDGHGQAYLSGALLDAWYAPSLRGDVRTGLGSWSKDDVSAFLKLGHNREATAFGSMIDVVNNSTPYLSDSDLDAVAVYLKSLPASAAQPAFVYNDATNAALRGGHPSQPGATVYINTCATCHGFDAKGFAPYMPALAGNPIVLDTDPSSLINLVLNGSNPLVVKGEPDAYRMPQFRLQLSDQDIADAVTFIRNGWGNQAPAVTAAQVASLRKTTDPTSDQVIILKMR